MARYALLFLEELDQIFLCSKFEEDSISFGYLETELNSTGEYFSVFNHL